MTEYETFTAIQTMINTAGISAMNSFAVLSAYLVVCFFVGNKLTRFQAISVTFLYTWFYSLPVIVIYRTTLNLMNGIEHFGDTYPDSFFQVADYPSFYPAFTCTVYIISWALSISYLLYIRLTPDKRDGSFQSISNSN